MLGLYRSNLPHKLCCNVYSVLLVFFHLMTISCMIFMRYNFKPIMLCSFFLKVSRSNKIHPAKCVPRKNPLAKFTMSVAHGIICEFTDSESSTSAYMRLESCLQLSYSFYCLCTFVFTPIPYVLAHSLSVSLFPNSASAELSIIMPLGEVLPTNKPLTCFS